MPKNRFKRKHNESVPNYERLHELEQLHQENRIFWREKLGRNPLEITKVYYLTDLAEINWACHEILTDPYYPGVFGLDCEFVSDFEEYANWDPPGNFPSPCPSHPFLKGVFCRLIQLAKCDGTCYVIDLYRCPTFPNSLYRLMTDRSVLKFGFACLHDFESIHNVYGRPVQPISAPSLKYLSKATKKQLKRTVPLFLQKEEILDVQEVYIKFKDDLVNVEYDELLEDFRPENLSFRDFVLETFGIEISKQHQGRLRSWDKPVWSFTDEEESYICKDALGALDLGLYFRLLNIWNEDEFDVNRMLNDFDRSNFDRLFRDHARTAAPSSGCHQRYSSPMFRNDKFAYDDSPPPSFGARSSLDFQTPAYSAQRNPAVANPNMNAEIRFVYSSSGKIVSCQEPSVCSSIGNSSDEPRAKKSRFY